MSHLAVECCAHADAKTRGDAPGGPQQAAPPLRKQARITTFFPSPSPQTVTPFPRDITRVSPQDLASLGWLQVRLGMHICA